MKNQDDMEQILMALRGQFELIKLTSFENKALENKEHKSAKMMLEESDAELKKLSKDLEFLQIDEEDVRHDVF